MTKIKTNNIDKDLLICYNDLLSEENISDEEEPLEVTQVINFSNYEVDDETKREENIFRTKIKQMGCDLDAKGIFFFYQNDKIYLTDFSKLEYVCNKVVNEEKIRVIKLNETKIEFKPNDLMNSNNFNKRLLS